MSQSVRQLLRELSSGTSIADAPIRYRPSSRARRIGLRRSKQLLRKHRWDATDNQLFLKLTTGQ
jgi:hypothetical protein